MVLLPNMIITNYLFVASLVVIFALLVWTISSYSSTRYMASEMIGQLVDEAGAPAVGVKVTRTWQTHTETGVDSATTDAEGRFSFGAVPKRRSFLEGLLPSTPVIDVQFTHDRDVDPTMFLRLAKLSYAPNAELEGQSIKVVCRVDQATSTGPGAIIRSTCRIED